MGDKLSERQTAIDDAKNAAAQAERAEDVEDGPDGDVDVDAAEEKAQYWKQVNSGGQVRLQRCNTEYGDTDWKEAPGNEAAEKRSADDARAGGEPAAKRTDSVGEETEGEKRQFLRTLWGPALDRLDLDAKLDQIVAFTGVSRIKALSLLTDADLSEAKAIQGYFTDPVDDGAGNAEMKEPEPQHPLPDDFVAVAYGSPSSQTGGTNRYQWYAATVVQALPSGKIRIKWKYPSSLSRLTFDACASKVRAISKDQYDSAKKRAKAPPHGAIGLHRADTVVTQVSEEEAHL